MNEEPKSTRNGTRHDWFRAWWISLVPVFVVVITASGLTGHLVVPDWPRIIIFDLIVSAVIAGALASLWIPISKSRENPKSVWRKSWTGRNSILLLAGLSILGVFLGGLIYALSNWEKPVSDTFAGAVMAGLIFMATCFLIVFVFLPLIRHWRRTLFGLACFATLAALFYAEEDWRGWHAWNEFKRACEVKGENIGYASIIPPIVPDDQNFAMAPVFDTTRKLANRKWRQLHQNPHPVNGQWWDTNLVDPFEMEIVDYGFDRGNEPIKGDWAKGTLTDLSAWQNYYRRLAATTNEFPVPSQPQTPSRDVLLALSKYDATVEDLRQASLRPYSRFPLDYDNEDPAAILLPHLASLKRCSQVLQLRALAELQASQTDKALADVKLSLRLVDSIRTEPVLISHLVRIAMLQIIIQPIYEGLVNHQWTDAQLAELDAELARLDFVADYKLAMHGETGFQDGIFNFLRQHPEELSVMSGGYPDKPSPPSWIFIHLIPRGWLYQNQLRCARPMVELILPVADAAGQTISPAKVTMANAAITAQISRPNVFNFMEHLFLSSLGNTARHFAYAQAITDVARTAIALERYRLPHGGYPESLDALTPLFGGKVPHDVINGQPLRYRLNGSGQFVLYSVGWNETDDGGVVVFQNSSQPRDESPHSMVDINQGDWVWRYPQK